MGNHILETEALRVTVADAGAELVSVMDKSSGAERIWTADPAVWNRHAPILFPFIGRVMDGKYRTEGKEFPMKKQHGFARDLEFSCTEETAASVTHRLTATEWTRNVYPYDFRLTMRHSISAKEQRRLNIQWTVENTGEKQMLFSIGGHPGFLLPKGVRKEDCSIGFSGNKEPVYFSVNASGFALPESRRALKLADGFAKYQPDVPDTWIFEEQGIDAVEIATPDGKPYVTLRCEGFPMLAVWANPKGPFICLEPWYGRTDDEGFAGTLSEKNGIQSLESGESKTASYSVEFHETGDTV